ncbi:MAG: hypothetical protein HYT08_01680 [Candidatus Levybacteria bacterium]|nr:hypothetical protein [Candidatus Levybacteria bacterium]
MKNRFFEKGQFIIELLITIGLTSMILPAILTGFFAVRSGSINQDQKIQAISYLKEAAEAVRIVRDADWAQIATNGTFHPVVSGSSWSLVSGSETLSPYNLTRQIVISDTYRDSNGAIVTSGGTQDPSTKKITITVSWNNPLLSSVESIMYLTRYHENASFIQSSETDFNSGTLSSTVVTNTDGGEITLGAGGSGSWCSPNLSITALDLPKNGVANAVSAIEGGAFTGTGENASGVSFANVSISNTNPPVASILGTFDGYKTNGVFGETNYAYLATDTGSKEIVIIDLTQLTNGKYAEAGYFNAPGNGRGESIFVSDNIGYMNDGNKLYTFDLSSKSGSRPQLGNVTLAATGSKVVVMGNYAYVAIAGAAQELQIIQVSNGGRTLSIVGSADVNGQAAFDVFVNSTATRAYLATGASSSQRELFIVDISTKTGSRPSIGNYDSNGMNPRGITVVPGNKAILAGSGGQEYQVIDITNEANPVECGGLQIDTGVRGVSGVTEQDGDAYAYIVTGDATTEFKIIEGGPGGQYSSSGTFTSAAFDAGSTVTYNRFIPTFSQPSQTNIQFQVAVADAVNGSCTDSTYYFVGPDGASNTYFSQEGPIPLLTNEQGYKNPGRCIKYKAYLSTTDLSQAPILYDVSFNYSP